MGRPAEHLGQGLLVCGECAAPFYFMHGKTTAYNKAEGANKDYKKRSYVHDKSKKCSLKPRQYPERVIDAILVEAFHKVLSEKPILVANIWEKQETLFGEVAKAKAEYSSFKSKVTKSLHDDKLTQPQVDRLFLLKTKIEEKESYLVEPHYTFTVRIARSTENAFKYFENAEKKNQTRLLKLFFKKASIKHGSVLLTFADHTRMRFELSDFSGRRIKAN